MVVIAVVTEGVALPLVLLLYLLSLLLLKLPGIFFALSGLKKHACAQTFMDLPVNVYTVTRFALENDLINSKTELYSSIS